MKKFKDGLSREFSQSEKSAADEKKNLDHPNPVINKFEQRIREEGYSPTSKIVDTNGITLHFEINNDEINRILVCIDNIENSDEYFVQCDLYEDETGYFKQEIGKIVKKEQISAVAQQISADVLKEYVSSHAAGIENHNVSLTVH